MAGNWKGTDAFLLDYKDPVANSDKFYEGFLVDPADSGLGDWLFVAHWGRNGSAGQVQVTRGSKPMVVGAHQKKYKEKAAKYSVVYTDRSTAISDLLMQQIEGGGVPLGGWEKNGWAAAVTDATTGVLVPQKVQIDISAFVQELITGKQVTPEHVQRRSVFLEQMADLQRQIDEAQAAADLMDTVYSARLAS